MIQPRHLWFFLFGVWFALLSGCLVSLIPTPGILQAIRLRILLNAKQTQLAQITTELHTLEAEVKDLELNPNTQRREIRRVLGYVAPNELIFDFNQSQ